jgi:COX Aromatic Rich Motif.
LTKQSYVELAKPSEYDPVKYYASVDKDMFHSIVMKYMQAHGSHGAMQHAMPEHSAHKKHSEDEE